MEGSPCESIKEASQCLSLCNLTNPVGLITRGEQRSIHLITKRCDKKRGNLGMQWEIIGQLEFTEGRGGDNGRPGVRGGGGEGRVSETSREQYSAAA